MPFRSHATSRARSARSAVDALGRVSAAWTASRHSPCGKSSRFVSGCKAAHMSARASQSRTPRRTGAPAAAGADRARAGPRSATVEIKARIADACEWPVFVIGGNAL